MSNVYKGTLDALNDSDLDGSLTSILAQLDITLSALRDAICDSGGDATTLKDVKDAIDSLETLSAEVTKWGGTVLTGRDISLDLAKLDITLSALRDALLGKAATFTASGPTIANTSTTALAANADRKTATFVNDSNETIYLRRGATAVMNQAIRLNASGGSFEINANNLYTGIVTAICASGGKILCVEEGV